MALSEILRERGYVYQHSSATLEEITDGAPRTFYLGVDPTAESLHIGHLQGVLVLRRFIEAGHKLILVIGGGTGMVGDPGGKNAERNLLDDATIAKNMDALRPQFTKLLGGVEFRMVNNSDWLHPLKYLEFLRDVGKHFTVNEMIKRDTVRTRIETPDQSISYTEFSYMLLQAYDFLHLHETSECDLQVGGSDQWGNLVSGVDLIRRKTGHSAYVFSWPLLVDKKTGKKFGKSETGALWLDPVKTSLFQFYQFWFNVEDNMVEELLLKMTLMPKVEIDTVLAEHRANPGARGGQKRLAREVTAMVHGSDEAEKAEKSAAALFSGSLEDLDANTPAVSVAIGTAIIDALVVAGLASSKREARQFVTDGAVSVNGEKANDRVFTESDFKDGKALLKRGKRHVCVLTLS